MTEPLPALHARMARQYLALLREGDPQEHRRIVAAEARAAGWRVLTVEQAEVIGNYMGQRFEFARKVIAARPDDDEPLANACRFMTTIESALCGDPQPEEVPPS